MNKREEAIAQIKLIYAVDAGYKDVSAKMDEVLTGALSRLSRHSLVSRVYSVASRGLGLP